MFLSSNLCRHTKHLSHYCHLNKTFAPVDNYVGVWHADYCAGSHIQILVHMPVDKYCRETLLEKFNFSTTV